MPLTVQQVRSTQGRTKPFGLADGGGLFLWVMPNNHKYWHFRYSFHGKQPRISLGTYPNLSLRQARGIALEYRTLLFKGIDPRETRPDGRRHPPPSGPLFGAIAEDWLKHKETTGRSPATLEKIRVYLDKDILPAFGAKHLTDITPAECIAVKSRIEDRCAFDAAKKVYRWLGEIFSHAIAQGLCERNPAREEG